MIQLRLDSLVEHFSVRGPHIGRIWKWLVASVALIVRLGIVGWFFFLETDAAPGASIEVAPTVDAPASAIDGVGPVPPRRSA
jgi:hypothetical protein